MKETHEHAVKRGKKSKASGAQFELRVRKDLEERWIVSKWPNNVEFTNKLTDLIPIVRNYGIKGTEKDFKQRQKERKNNLEINEIGKLVAAKNKFRGIGIPMMMGAGFPDFVAFRVSDSIGPHNYYEVIGVEAKSNGYLDPTERKKCEWLLKNKVFSKILIAKKHKVKNRIVIIYEEFK